MKLVHKETLEARQKGEELPEAESFYPLIDNSEKVVHSSSTNP